MKEVTEKQIELLKFLGTCSAGDFLARRDEFLQAFKDDSMIERKSCDAFRDTGLLVFVNQFLQIFGWSIVVEYQDDGKAIMYPARSKFRGFDEKSISDSYNKISKYMFENSDQLLDDCNEPTK